MHIAYVACAVVAGFIAVSLPGPVHENLPQEHFLSIQQRISVAYPQGEVTGSIAGTLQAGGQQFDAGETAEFSRGLTCEQIRIMDEVELITDDSYCT